MNLIFATANLHKVEEAQNILGKEVTLQTPADFGYLNEIPETGETLEENALQKARTIWHALGQNCFADDTGLEVFALNGAPGVYSARYASLPSLPPLPPEIENLKPETENLKPETENLKPDMNANIERLLKELAPHPNRNAQFRCVIALILNGNEYLFEGAVQGSILPERQGSRGFGYDPLFLPHGYAQTFATISSQEKNAISHRALALSKLKKYLFDCEL